MATTSDLRKSLKQIGAKTTGRKSQLKERLKLWVDGNLGKSLIAAHLVKAKTNMEFPIDGFQPIIDVTKDCMNWSAIDSWFTERNSEKGLKNGRILAMKLFVKCTTVRIEGSLIFVKSFCAAEQRKNKDYIVQLLICKNPSVEIWQANCACPAGKGWSASCKHIAAVCFSLEHLTITGRLQEYVSCTSTPINWNKPPAGRHVNFMTIFQIVKKNKPEINVSEEKTTEMLNNLINYAMPCSLLESRRVNSIGYLHDHGFYTTEFCSNYIYSINYITINERSSLEAATRDQSKSKLWIDLRRSRITGSIIGECMRTVSFGKFAHSPALKNIKYDKKIKFCKSVKWGVENEKYVKDEYEKVMKIKMNPSGLWIHHIKHFLASSPDGVSFAENVVLEIKCPYSIRDKSPTEAKYLIKRNDIFSLNKKHPYYAQCQMHMYVTNIDVCDFVIWTTKGLYIEHIPINKRFVNEMVQQAEIYYNKVFSRLYTTYAMMK